ncbi:hypothetical protein SADUNF_Sadunf16G0164400 [Salix dunnii]|uniref:Uncharacterized protein n=1 Tax=Salix dunnii TaxID=1413687 RepID=A0A835MGQ2_9ROSI|nr:hypothetical protein SADUNF_Sadunf16G0164400 [Salix dunnii]
MVTKHGNRFGKACRLNTMSWSLLILGSKSASDGATLRGSGMLSVVELWEFYSACFLEVSSHESNNFVIGIQWELIMEEKACQDKTVIHQQIISTVMDDDSKLRSNKISSALGGEEEKVQNEP